MSRIYCTKHFLGNIFWRYRCKHVKARMKRREQSNIASGAVTLEKMLDGAVHFDASET